MSGRKPAYKNRTAKHRAIRTTKTTLPQTPTKRVEVIKSLALDSPNTRASLEEMGVIRSPEEQEAASVSTAVFTGVRKALAKNKTKRTNDARAAVQVGLGYLVGDKG